MFIYWGIVVNFVDSDSLKILVILSVGIFFHVEDGWLWAVLILIDFQSDGQCSSQKFQFEKSSHALLMEPIPSVDMQLSPVKWSRYLGETVDGWNPAPVDR